MASGIYNVFKGNLMKKEVNLHTGGDTIKVALLDNSHSFTATNTVWSNVSANEISGTGYTEDGATLGSQAVTVGATTKFAGANTSWSSATFTAYHAVLYDVTNSNSLICSFDFGGAQEVTAGTFTLQWHADGIISIA
jgi:uncharacterized protein YjiK